MPCTALFDFSHLGHLEEDAVNGGNTTTSSSSSTAAAAMTTDYLKEGTKLKMPLWALDKWSTLGYVTVQIPRHFNQKAREKLEADPLAVDLRYETPKRKNKMHGTNRVTSDFYLNGICKPWELCCGRSPPPLPPLIPFDTTTILLTQTLFFLTNLSPHVPTNPTTFST